MVKFLVENGACVFATTLSDDETAPMKCEKCDDGYQQCYDYLMDIQVTFVYIYIEKCIRKLIPFTMVILVVWIFYKITARFRLF